MTTYLLSSPINATKYTQAQNQIKVADPTLGNEHASLKCVLSFTLD